MAAFGQKSADSNIILRGARGGSDKTHTYLDLTLLIYTILPSSLNNLLFTNSSTISTGVWILEIMLSCIDSTVNSPNVAFRESAALLMTISTRPPNSSAILSPITLGPSSFSKLHFIPIILMLFLSSAIKAEALRSPCRHASSIIVSSSWFRLLIERTDSEVAHVPRMEQPRDARLRAMARPIPREAPVTTATL